MQKQTEDTGVTLIQIYNTTWKELNNLKNKGESFNDVLIRLLKKFQEKSK